MREEAPNVCFLIETRLDMEGFDKLYGELPFLNKIIVKKPYLRGGLLALIWKNEVQLELINYTANHILVKVTEEDDYEWWPTCFYGWPDVTQRSKSWELLDHIKSFVGESWMCIGDFNAILHSTEKLSKRLPQLNQMEAFCEALKGCQLEDLRFKGYPFTWNNKRPEEANTKLRLDRVVATVEWKNKFQLSSVTHLPPPASDHLPLILQTNQFRKNSMQRRIGFKFEEAWLLWEECEEVVKNSWEGVVNGGHGLEGIKDRIWVCGENLRMWGLSKTKHNAKEIKSLQRKLEELNSEVVTKESRAEFLEVNKNLDDLLMKQEIYWA